MVDPTERREDKKWSWDNQLIRENKKSLKTHEILPKQHKKQLKRTDRQDFFSDKTSKDSLMQLLLRLPSGHSILDNMLLININEVCYNIACIGLRDPPRAIALGLETV